MTCTLYPITGLSPCAAMRTALDGKVLQMWAQSEGDGRERPRVIVPSLDGASLPFVRCPYCGAELVVEYPETKA